MGEKERIDGHTKLVGLIGSPVGHSLSPALHNLSFENLGVNAAYLAFETGPDDVADTMAAFKRIGVAGCNVTMPIKRAVIPYLDSISKEAELMQAINVIKFEDGKAHGFNADGPGFVESLKKEGVDVPASTMTVLGAGGVGTPIIVSNAFAGAKKINIFAREGGASYKVAQELLPKLAAEVDTELCLFDFADTEALKAAIDESNVLINATSVGMGEEGNTDTPIDADLIKPGMTVVDAIYQPRVTQLMRDAEAKGCKTANGLGLLVEQAAIGEKIWFDVDMDTDMIREKIFSA